MFGRFWRIHSEEEPAGSRGWLRSILLGRGDEYEGSGFLTPANGAIHRFTCVKQVGGTVSGVRPLSSEPLLYSLKLATSRTERD